MSTCLFNILCDKTETVYMQTFLCIGKSSCTTELRAELAALKKLKRMTEKLWLFQLRYLEDSFWKMN